MPSNLHVPLPGRGAFLEIHSPEQRIASEPAAYRERGFLELALLLRVMVLSIAFEEVALPQAVRLRSLPRRAKP